MSDNKRLTIGITKARHLKLTKMVKLFDLTQEEMLGLLIEMVDPDQIKSKITQYKMQKAEEEQKRKEKLEKLQKLTPEQMDLLLEQAGLK